jgi:hypothetical protein
LGPALISYRALRRIEPALWGIGLPLALDAPEPTLDQVLAAVTAHARKGKESESCLEVAKLFYEAIRRDGFRAVANEFRRLPLSGGVSVTFCADTVLLKDATPVVAAVNYRRSGFTTAGLRFAFSAMHEQSRALDRDLRTARLAVLQFAQPPGKRPRHATLTYGDDVDLLTYDQIASMAAETCAIWDDIQDEAEEAARRTGTDDAGWWGKD